MSAGAAEARHRVANLLHGYTEIADRKDVDAVVNLLGRSRVRFPAGGSDDAESVRVFFTGLWSAPVGHRHDVSNLVVEPAQEPGTWRARAHYTRWVLAPSAPVRDRSMSAAVIDATTVIACRARVTATFSRRSPPVRFSGPNRIATLPASSGP